MVFLVVALGDCMTFPLEILRDKVMFSREPCDWSIFPLETRDDNNAFLVDAGGDCVMFLLESQGGNVAFTADIRGDSRTSFDVLEVITTLSLEVRGEDVITEFEIRGDKTASSFDSRGLSVAFSIDPPGDASPFPNDALDDDAIFCVEPRATSLEL